MNIQVIHYEIIFCMAMSLLLSSCGNDSRQRELQRYITELKSSYAQKEVTARSTTWELPVPVTYHPVGYSGSQGQINAKSNITNPLQAYSVKDLQFVGVLTEGNQISAYIMTPDTQIYLAKVGDIIGEDYGKIIKIDADHLEISVKSDNQPNGQTVVMDLKDSSK